MTTFVTLAIMSESFMFSPSGTHYICERNRESNIQAIVEEHYERYIHGPGRGV